VLVLRLDAPMMSFGGAMVDSRGVTDDSPGLSLLTGLLANALGYDHRDWELTEALQERVRFGARRDRHGQIMVDYHTVDLGRPYMRQGWTTRGRVEGREGGSAREGTHIRLRHYLADAVFTVVVGLQDHGTGPSLGDLVQALQEPARPLFLGRKTCLPAAPLFDCVIEAASIREALASVPRYPHADQEELLAWWPTEAGDHLDENLWVATTNDRRDFQNQIHTGRRSVTRGLVNPPKGAAV
jgi:CRISPR system Cascade subunit CasD